LKKEDAAIEVDRIFKSIDTNENGKIDYSEFLVASMNKKIMLSK